MFLLADIVWPALVLVGHLMAWPIIAVGLLIEAAFVYYIYRASMRDTLVMTIGINLMSTAFGIVLIPLLGAIWELITGRAVYFLFHFGTFNLINWFATFILATISNTVIEIWGLKKIFKRPVTKRIFGLIFFANSISVALAIISIYFSAPPNGGPGIF